MTDEAYQETSPAFYGRSPSGSPLLNAHETAEFLGLSLPTVLRMTQSGEIPAHRIEVVTGVGRGHRVRQRWAFDRDELDDWIESCRIEPGTLRSGQPWERAATTDEPRRAH